MGNKLKDKVAIITGSGQGVGRAIALAMANEGARIVTNGRSTHGSPENVAKEITELGGQAIPFIGDISNFKVARELVQTALNRFGRLDILVNNAGRGDGGKMVWDMTEEDWDNMIASHLKGTFNCIRHASVIMKEQRWGRIVNTTSGARVGMVERCHYSAAKAGIVGLTKSVALEMDKFGVTCNAYSPSAGSARWTQERKAELDKYLAEGTVTKEFHDYMLNPPPPEANVALVVYLCTDEAAYINGQVFSVRGGKIRIYKEEVKNSVVKEEGFWEVEELVASVPKVLMKGIESRIGPTP
jgi:3-oxoacyl-[acyl-carrier protein] reductase